MSVDIPEGWKVWSGGDRAPDDYGGGVMFKGASFQCHFSDPTCWEWEHVIAYKPREEEPFALCEVTVKACIDELRACGPSGSRAIEVLEALLPPTPEQRLASLLANRDNLQEALSIARELATPPQQEG